jgi:pimeloyl-ACP methyl ester carboxylesterase
VRALALGGERDGQNFPALAKHIADTIPGAALVVIPNVGHVPHIQVPDTFNRELLTFPLSEGTPDLQSSSRCHSD